jgi:hypothetical protein
MADKNFFTEIIPEYMNLHSTLPTQAGLEKKIYRQVRPTHSIESTGPIQFQIPSGSEYQIYPAGIRIELNVQIRNEDGTPVGAVEDPATAGVSINANRVIPVNGFAYAMFSDIEVMLNDTKIASYDGTYAYRADLQNRLFTSVSNKKHSLMMCGHVSEEIPFDDISATVAEANASAGFGLSNAAAVMAVHNDDSPKSSKVWNRRLLESRRSRTLRYIDRLYSEIFNQPKLLPPGAKLSIQLERSKPAFCLLTAQHIRMSVHIESAILHVPIIKVETNFVRELEYQTYEGEDMHYPVRRVELHAYNYGPNVRNLSKDDILVGSVTPRRIFVVMIESSGFQGDYKKDPFNYQHFSLQEMKCLLGGQLGSVPPIVCDDRVQNGHIYAVFSLLNTLGSEGESGEEIGIDIRNFTKRNNIYAFDISGLAGVELVNAFTKEMKQPTGLGIQLREARRHPITVLVYKEFDSEIEINKSGTVRILPYA